MDHYRAENERRELACSRLKLEAFELMDERDKLRAENEDLKSRLKALAYLDAIKGSLDTTTYDECVRLGDENEELRGLLESIFSLIEDGNMDYEGYVYVHINSPLANSIKTALGRDVPTEDE